MVHAGLISVESQDKQSQRIFHKPCNFMGNDAGMFKRSLPGVKQFLSLVSLQFYFSSDVVYRKLHQVYVDFKSQSRIHGENHIKARPQFIWETTYHNDQHSVEVSALFHLIDHSATHFHKD